MSVIEVQGLTPLEGEIKIQGSKNAVLPMMAAAILHKGTTVIENVPRIQDVFCMLGILDSIGCKCRLEGNRLKIDASVVTETEIPKSCEEYALLDHCFRAAVRTDEESRYQFSRRLLYRGKAH